MAPVEPSLIANLAVRFAGFAAVQYLTGLLVERRGVRVNYTRKLNHFAIFFYPVLVDGILPYAGGTAARALTGAVTVAAFAIYVRPIRERVRVLRTMFASFDRPEDRPHTLAWFATQVAVGYAVIIPALALFEARGLGCLAPIPLLVNGIGDGLAEPVGVRFGRHAYRVRALFGGRRYTRTLEGSLCVLLCAALVVVAFGGCFEPSRFVAALVVVPLLMTLAEAFSPHTWDTPFLFAVGYGGLYVVGTW